MTVTVTLPDGATDKYMRFGDAYIKHNDGRLDVVRGGAKQPYSYAWGTGPTLKATKRVGRRAVSGADRSPQAVEHPWRTVYVGSKSGSS